MPTKLSIFLQGDPGQRHGSYVAPLLQGVLMELIDSSYAKMLHMNQMHPYSQYVERKLEGKGESIIWHVNCLTEEAEKEIIPVLCKENLTEITLKHRDECLHIVKRQMEKVTEKELIDQYYFAEHSKLLHLRFVTPTSFKHDGSYVIFPSVRLIFQSLMNKFDASSSENQVFSDELLEHYEKYAHIVGYRLRSTVFYMENTKIPSFMGDITIRINGPQQMLNMAWMLAEFGTFSGVGIKTGLGMGGLEILTR